MTTPTLCSMAMMCPSTMDSLTNIGKIVGIVVGCVIGLAFLICIIIIAYLIFCKRKPRAQVWAYPSATPQSYGQTMPMFPYTNYPQESIPSVNRQRIIESPPPAYEEINTIENSSKKY